jgi:hypothetical protein
MGDKEPAVSLVLFFRIVGSRKDEAPPTLGCKLEESGTRTARSKSSSSDDARDTKHEPLPGAVDNDGSAALLLLLKVWQVPSSISM